MNNDQSLAGIMSTTYFFKRASTSPIITKAPSGWIVTSPRHTGTIIRANQTHCTRPITIPTVAHLNNVTFFPLGNRIRIRSITIYFTFLLFFYFLRFRFSFCNCYVRCCWTNWTRLKSSIWFGWFSIRFWTLNGQEQ